jgi:hypothetical protein
MAIEKRTAKPGAKTVLNSGFPAFDTGKRSPLFLGGRIWRSRNWCDDRLVVNDAVAGIRI